MYIFRYLLRINYTPYTKQKKEETYECISVIDLKFLYLLEIMNYLL